MRVGYRLTLFVHIIGQNLHGNETFQNQWSLIRNKKHKAMKKSHYIYTLFILLLVGTNSIKADWIEPARYQQMLGSGIDVDWWTDANEYASQDWNNAVSDFREAGIQHVRIALSKEYMSPDDLMLLDRQVDLCVRNGITPIIAYQPDFSGRFTPSRRARVARWWRNMAEHYRGYTARLSFEILLEPNSTMFATYDELNGFYDDCVSAIRISNPYRIVFIAPACNSDPMYLQYLRIPSRANGYLMAEWHFLSRGKYRAFWHRWNTRRAYEQRWLNARIETALAWQRRTGIYTWVGGWSPGLYVGRNYAAAPESLTEFLCTALLRAGLPYAVRDVHHFYNYRTRAWNEAAHRPMRHFFPHGGFAHRGAPVAPPSPRNGFSIGGKRFDSASGPAMRPAGIRDGRRDNRSALNEKGFRIENPYGGHPGRNGAIRFGGNGRSENKERYSQMPDRNQNSRRNDYKNSGRPDRKDFSRPGLQNGSATRTSRPQSVQPANSRFGPAGKQPSSAGNIVSKSGKPAAPAETPKRSERKGGGGFSRGNNR